MALDDRDPKLELLVMNDMDNVATALLDITPGTTARFILQGEERGILVVNQVPFGHKVAIVSLMEREEVIKYGDVIGQSSCAIQVGQHVHVHNVDGIRGRGDLGVNGGVTNTSI